MGAKLLQLEASAVAMFSCHNMHCAQPFSLLTLSNCIAKNKAAFSLLLSLLLLCRAHSFPPLLLWLGHPDICTHFNMSNLGDQHFVCSLRGLRVQRLCGLCRLSPFHVFIAKIKSLQRDWPKHELLTLICRVDFYNETRAKLGIPCWLLRRRLRHLDKRGL